LRSRFPPSSLKQPDVLHEEWYSSPLEAIKNIFQEGYKLYYGQMVAELCVEYRKVTLSQLFPLFCPPFVYRVPEGISMGSPISSIIAKIFTTL